MFAHVAFVQGRRRRIIEGIEQLAAENRELISKNEIQEGTSQECQKPPPAERRAALQSALRLDRLRSAAAAWLATRQGEMPARLRAVAGGKLFTRQGAKE